MGGLRIECFSPDPADVGHSGGCHHHHTHVWVTANREFAVSERILEQANGSFNSRPEVMWLRFILALVSISVCNIDLRLLKA